MPKSKHINDKTYLRMFQSRSHTNVLSNFVNITQIPSRNNSLGIIRRRNMIDDNMLINNNMLGSRNIIGNNPILGNTTNFTNDNNVNHPRNNNNLLHYNVRNVNMFQNRNNNILLLNNNNMIENNNNIRRNNNNMIENNNNMIETHIINNSMPRNYNNSNMNIGTDSSNERNSININNNYINPIDNENNTIGKYIYIYKSFLYLLEEMETKIIGLQNTVNKLTKDVDTLYQKINIIEKKLNPSLETEHISLAFIGKKRELIENKQENKEKKEGPGENGEQKNNKNK